MDYSKFEIFILTLSDEKENSRIKEFKALPIKVYQITTSNKNIMLGRLKRIKKIITEEKIEIVHSHCIASTIVASKIPNIYKISTIHCDFKTDLYFRFKFKGIIYSYLYKFFLGKMDLNISCGEGVSKLNQIHSGVKSISIMNGIEEEKINLENILENREQIREKLKIPQDKKIFITVSSIDKRKNILFLAKVFKEELKDYIFIIIGDGDKREELEKLIRGAKNIYYYGKKSLIEVQFYLKVSDLYISASKSEGMPNSVLEALQFELPVVLSDIDAHKEINNLGKIGIIFKNNDKKDLKNKIEEIIKNIPTKIEITKIKSVISAKRMSREYMEIYFREEKNEYL